MPAESLELAPGFEAANPSIEPDTFSRVMISRIVVWSLTLGLAGAVIADYSSYDTTLVSTLRGAILGCIFGVVVALAISYAGRRAASIDRQDESPR
jgi:ABC-type phosphate/phosphonate transport system permease subunit